MNLVKELLILFAEFEKDIDNHNRFRKTAIDDDVEPTLENFIKWLRHKE